MEMEIDPEEELTYTQAEGENELVNLYNDQSVYHFEKDGCGIYYKCDPLAKFAIVNGTYIISLPNNELISSKKLEDINKYITLSFARNKDMNPQLICIVEPTDCFKIDEDYLSNAQSVVAELNVELDKVGLCMVIDYKMNMTGEVTEMEISALTDLLLCLYIKGTNKCVSSVEMIEEGEDNDGKVAKNISINSITNHEYEGLKYNKLNRAAVIMIAGRTGHKSVVSFAVHPSSVWLFLNSFKGTINPKHSGDFAPPDGTPSYKYLETYLDKLSGVLEVVVAVNEGSVKLAAKVFAEVVSGLGRRGGRFPLQPPSQLDKFRKRPTKKNKRPVERPTERPTKKNKRPTKKGRQKGRLKKAD